MGIPRKGLVMNVGLRSCRPGGASDYGSFGLSIWVYGRPGILGSRTKTEAHEHWQGDQESTAKTRISQISNCELSDFFHNAVIAIFDFHPTNRSDLQLKRVPSKTKNVSFLAKNAILPEETLCWRC
jgi:hypothetical protein